MFLRGQITVVNKTKGLSVQSIESFSVVFPKGGRLIRDSFKDNVDLTSAEQLADIALADIDGDGWNDVIMSEVYKAGFGVFRNLGNGGTLSTSSFATKARFLTGGGHTNGAGMAIADLDNDGKLDAIHSTGRTAFTGAFATFRNISTPGNVAFEPIEMWDGLSDESPILVVGDIDGDGLAEMVGAEVGSGGGDFWIIQNISTPGNIEFIASKQYASNSVRDGKLVDLNNDGKPELIINTGSTLDVWVNNSTPGTILFSSTVQIPIVTDLNFDVADLNKDGKKDIVYGNFYSGDDIKIRINTNSGGALDPADFTTQVILRSDLNYGNRGIFITDMNGDGKPDIVANDATNTAVFENIYDGGAFNASAFIEAYPLEGTGGSTYPRSPAIGDLNGDGKPELVFGTTNGTSIISIFENQNVHAPKISSNTITPLKGTVGSTVTITGSDFSTTPSENLVTFGQVNGTVISATETQLQVEVPAGASLGQISVTKNRLTSTYHLPFVPTFSPGVVFNNTHLSAPTTFTLTNAGYEVSAGDLNLDGKPDIFADGNGSSTIFRNTYTTGTIASSSLTSDGTALSATTSKLRDLDGDGKLDATGSVGQFRNTTTGTNITFDPYAYVSPGGNYFNDYADINNDGKIETIGVSTTNVVINENRTTSGAFKTYDPFYSFAASTVLPKAGNGGSVAAGDFDKDGLIDLVATNASTNNMSLWKNNGAYRVSTTQFTTLTAIALGTNPSSIHTSDIDVDGKIDIVITHGAGVSSTTLIILRNTTTSGTITFSRFDITLPGSATMGNIADLDGDGKPDILITSEVSDQLFILKNTSTPGTIDASSFAAAFQFAVTNPRGITTSDLNLNGKPEIIISSAPNSLLVYENLVPIGPSITITTQPTFTYACAGSSATFSVDASGVANITYRWQKFDGSVYADISDGAGYTGTATKTLSINTATTGFAGNGQYRARINGDLAPEVFSNDATLTINSLPSPPDVVGDTECTSPATVTLTATGASNGDYNWYDVATGGAVLGTNGSFTTPSITTTKTYFVSISDTFCESVRVPVDATITVLAKPTLQSNEPIVSGGINICDGEDCTITAPTGFVAYTWSNGETDSEITVGQAGNYSVTVEDANGCVSPASDPVTVTVNPYPIAEINVNGTLLTATSGDSYQWYQNGDEISGATSQTFEFNVLEYGIYAVDVTDNGCTTTSDDFAYLITGTEVNTGGLKIYPNPVTQNSLFIESDESAVVKMIDSSGKLVLQQTVKSGEVNPLQMQNVAAGSYLIQITSGTTKRYVRIFKTN